MSKKKQFVVIMTDSQRADMLNCYKNTGLKTPCLDRLCEEGIRFDTAYTCQPVCGPARSAIFTGLFPHTNGSFSNCMALASDVKTIGQRLRAKNIHTGYIGKWHLDGGDYFGNGECPDGWDPKYWYDMRNYLDELTPEERLMSRNSKAYQTNEIPKEFTYAHRCSNRALEFIREHADEDFFLTVSYDEPHDPCLCPREYVEQYKNYEFPKNPNVCDTLEDKPEYQKVWAGNSLKQDRDAIKIKNPEFFGCNSFVDYEIGRVLDEISAQIPEACVLYTSDHGDALNSHCLFAKGPSIYNEIAHIPFIMKCDGAKGQYIPPVSHIDIVPTILDYFGMDIPKKLAGKSLMPIIKDKTTRVNDDVYVEFTRYEVDHDSFGGIQMMRAIVNERYKLAIHLLDSDEMYDLQNDPNEMHNIINDEKTADIRDAMHDKLLDHMNVTRDPFRGYYWERRPWRKTARPATWEYTNYTRQKETEPDEKRQLDYITGLEITESTRLKTRN